MYTFSFKKVHLKMSSAKWRPFCLGLNVLTLYLLSRVSTDNECINPVLPEYSSSNPQDQLARTAWQLRHNERDGVSNHRRHDCLLNRLFRRWSKKTSKLRVTGLCEGNSPVTVEFPSQRDSDVENVSIWWRHHCEIWVDIDLPPPTHSSSVQWSVGCKESRGCNCSTIWYRREVLSYQIWKYIID